MNTAATIDGMSELHRAADEGNLERVASLLQSGARTDKANNENQFPLYCALNLDTMDEGDEKERREAIFRLLWGADPDTVLHVDEDGNTVLHQMARYGFDELARDVLTKHPNLALLPNHQGECPIHRAVLSNRLDVVKALFHVEGVSSLVDYKLSSALHLAARSGTLEMVTLCCKQSPEMLNKKDRFNNTPYALAGRFNTPETQEYLQAQPGISTMIDTSAITKVG
jgi:uncharacterized protein